MALNTFTGVFSEVMFHPDVFDTGTGGSKLISSDDFMRDRIRQEDFEIIEFIIAVTESGQLDE